MHELQQITKLDCKYILKYLCCERRSEHEVILITEMITRGQLSTYLSEYKHPKISICQCWLKQILFGIQYIHAHSIIHGHIACDHIYINSNTGELKIGDLGLVKLPGILAYGFSYHRPIDDIHHFGLVALEIAFAQFQEPRKLRQIMKRLYEAPSIDNRKLRKLVEHIEDPEYRSLVESCLFAESYVPVDNILKHQFFTSARNKEDVLIGIKNMPKLFPYQTKNIQKMGICVTYNTLISNPKLESPIINVTIKTVGRHTTSKITFHYNINNDTPERVAEEMRESLNLPMSYIDAVQNILQTTGMDKYYNNKFSERAH